MRNRKATCRYRELEQMPTSQLDALLQNEIRKEAPNENIVLPILKVIEERERDYPVEVSEQVMSVWAQYQERVKPQHNAMKNHKRPRFAWVATMAAVICLIVLSLPLAANADSALDVLYRVTSTIVEFFRPDGRISDSEGEYIFETDNPGLQQVYDTIAKMGVTVPVVPMWLPEGAVLTELKESEIPGGIKVYAKFDFEGSASVIQIMIFEDVTPTQYEQDNGVEIYDVCEVKHIIVDNGDYLSAVWSNGNIEGMVNITENKDDLRKIIASIYWRK